MNQELTRAVEGLMPQALDDLAALVAMRSVADERVEDPEELAKAARWVVNACDELGFASRLAPTPDGTDTVIAHYEGPKGTPKVLLYSHYDVQPAPTRG
ncbi:MAG TPA: dipeptidase, partial [Beutenbergiaceae bacterium]|nr:dipeptidase [Beutenbergiaceae bacterium]